jgi:hypothetical protein
VRLAELLAAHGLRGTFYVPITNPDFAVLKPAEITTLQQLDMEIGAHTYSHTVLPLLDSATMSHELLSSKARLEDIVAGPITSFCYPQGKFDARTRQQTIEAGYQLARTTLSFRLEHNFDPFLMPTSFQFVPHPPANHVRHAIKEGNLKGLMQWITSFGARSNLIELLDVMFQYILRQGGILHLWGHSWEIEQEQLWEVLDTALGQIGHHPDVLYLTNAQTLEAVRLGNS